MSPERRARNMTDQTKAYADSQGTAGILQRLATIETRIEQIDGGCEGTSSVLSARMSSVEEDMGKLARDTIRNVEECATRVAALAKRVEELEAHYTTLRGSAKSAQEEIEALAKRVEACEKDKDERCVALSEMCDRLHSR